MAQAVAVEMAPTYGKTAAPHPTPAAVPAAVPAPEQPLDRKPARERVCWVACCLHVFTCGTLSHAYVGSFGALLHRVALLLAWERLGNPIVGLVFFLILWVVDIFMLSTRIRDFNENMYHSRKYVVEAYIQALAPPLCLCGSTHYYLRDWSRAGLMTASLGGCGLWSIGDWCRISGMVEAANERVPAQRPVHYEVRAQLVRWFQPTLRAISQCLWPWALDAAPPAAGATAVPEYTPAEQDADILDKELQYLSLCPCSGLIGGHKWHSGAPRQGLVYGATFGGFFVAYIVDLCTYMCWRDMHAEHSNVRKVALDAGVPAPREPMRLANLYGLWLPTGLVGAHHWARGALWLGAAYTLSLGGFGLMWLADAFWMPGYHAKQKAGREREVAFAHAAAQAVATGHSTLHIPSEHGADLDLVLLGHDVNQLASQFNAVRAHDEPAINPWVAWACWVPFGGLLGLHHFYLGRYMHGLAAALSLNFLVFGWIADGFMMSTYLADAGKTGRVPTFPPTNAPAPTPAPAALQAQQGGQDIGSFDMGVLVPTAAGATAVPAPAIPYSAPGAVTPAYPTAAVTSGQVQLEVGSGEEGTTTVPPNQYV